MPVHICVGEFFVEEESMHVLCTCTVTCGCGVGSLHFVGGDGIGTMHILWKERV